MDSAARPHSPLSDSATRRLRVAYVYRKFARSGSIASLYARTVERLAGDFDVTAVCGTHERANTDAAVQFLDVDPARVGAGRLTYAIECRSFASRATRAVLEASPRYDLVHTEGFACLWADVVTAHSVRRAELEHYFDHVEPAAFVRRRLSPKLFRPQVQVVLDIEEKLFAAPAPAVICPSRQVKDDLHRYHGVPGELVTVIPYGIDVDAFGHSAASRARIRGMMGADVDTLVVLVVADEFERKGVARLIEALSRSTTQAELWVIGGDDPRTYLKAARSAGVADRVRFLGRKPHTELPQWYAACDVVALVSRQDSWALPVIEGMAAGRVVLASEFTGSCEAITTGETGFVVALDGDPSEIAALLDGPLADPRLREEVGARAGVVARTYDVEVAHASLVDVYHRAARRRSERPMPGLETRTGEPRAHAKVRVAPERAA